MFRFFHPSLLLHIQILLQSNCNTPLLHQAPVIVLLSFLLFQDTCGSNTEVDLSKDTAVPSAETDGATGARSIAPKEKDAEDRPPVTLFQTVSVTFCAACLLGMYDGMQVRHYSTIGLFFSGDPFQIVTS